jgi:hypothetical protein
MEIFSARPNNPIVVVKIKIQGPNRANELLRSNAFPTSFIFIKAMATEISTNPEKIRNKDMPNMDLSMTWNNRPLPLHFVTPPIYMHGDPHFRTRRVLN